MWGPKTTNFWVLFHKFATMVITYGIKHNTDNQKNGIGNYQRSPTFLQNFMNFGPQIAVHSASLPAFAHN